MNKRIRLEVSLTLVIYLVIILLNGIGDNQEAITGNAVLEKPQDAQVIIQEIVRDEMFGDLGPLAKVCIGVKNSSNGTYFFKVRKQGELFNVQPSTNYCDGISGEDLVLVFLDYDRLLSLKDKLSFDPLVEDSTGEYFQIWQSKYVKSGGLLLCDQKFKEQYCTFINNQLNNQEQKAVGTYSCCKDVAVEKPSAGFISLLKRYWWIIAVIVGILVLGTTATLLLINKDDDEDDGEDIKKIEDYILSTRKQDFNDGEIRGKLIEAGWEKDDIEKAFDSIRKQHLSNLGERFEKANVFKR